MRDRPYSKPNDVRIKVILFVILSFFCLGLPRVITNAAAFTLFVNAFGAGLLPYTYLGAAVVAPVIGTAFLRFQRRLPLWNLLLMGLALDALVLTAAWLGLSLGVGRPVIMAATIWVEVEWMIAGLVFWGLAERMFTIREAKDYFGLIGAGEPAALVAGGLSIPVLLLVLKTNDLLLVSALSMVLAMALIWIIRLRLGEDFQNAEEQNKDASPTEGGSVGRLRALWSFGRYTRYVHLIFVITLLAEVIHFFIDNVFYMVGEAEFPTQDSLAKFVGLFFAVTGLVNLVFSTVGSAWLMRRFGVGMALGSLPTLTTLVAAGAAVTRLVPAPVGFLFVLISLLKLVDEAVRNGLYASGLRTAFQPLPPVLRSRAHAMNGGYVEQVAAGVGGLTLLGLNSLFDENKIIGLVVVIMVLSLPWLGLAGVQYRAYVDVLGQAFMLHRISAETVILNADRARSMALSQLSSPNAGEAIYALDILERTESSHLAGAVHRVIDHPDPDARRWALTMAGRLRMTACRDAILARLRNETDTAVIGVGLRSLALCAPEESIDVLSDYLDAEDGQSLIAAFVGLMRDCGIEGMLTAGGRFLDLYRSDNAQDRLTAALILEELASPQTYRLVLANLRSPDRRVRKLALRTAAKAAAPAFRPALLEALSSPRDGAAAVTALAAQGEEALVDVTGLYRNPATDSPTRARAARVLGHMRSPRALAFLAAQASSGHLDDRYAVARALDAGRFRASDNQAEALWNHGLDVAECLDRLDRIRVERNDEAGVTLRHWIAHARGRQRERLVLLLGCVLPRNLVRATNRRLSLGTEEDRAYALEALETHLPFRHRARLVPVLCPAPDPSPRVGGHQDETRQLATQRETESTDDDGCSTLAEDADGFFPPALQAAALLACWRFGRPISADALARTASSPDRFLSAIAHVLRSPAPERESSMLDIEKMIILRSVPVFKDLSEQSLADIAGALEEEEVTAGREIIREGEIGDRLYVVVKGDYEVLKGGQVVATLGERNVFGEMALLDPEVRSATVRATHEGLLLSLDHCTLEELMEGDVDLAQAFLKMLCGRLRDANRKLAATSRSREGL